MSRGGVVVPTPEWRGYCYSADDIAHWAERMHMGELAPDAPASDSMRQAIAAPTTAPTFRLPA